MCPLLLHSTLRVPSPCVCRQHENTSVPGIYALGDCTTHGFELTPVAIAAGRRLADRLFAGEPRARIAYETIATVVFSHPPIGTIGLTEPDARREFGEANVTVKQARFASMQYGLNAADAKVKTALKLVLAGPEERVVGLHCIGPCSDEMMQVRPPLAFPLRVPAGASAPPCRCLYPPPSPRDRRASRLRCGWARRGATSRRRSPSTPRSPRSL